MTQVGSSELLLAVHTSELFKEVTTTTPWTESASDLYRPSDHRLSAEVSDNFCG
jgi:hypothetical protein